MAWTARPRRRSSPCCYRATPSALVSPPCRDSPTRSRPETGRPRPSQSRATGPRWSPEQGSRGGRSTAPASGRGRIPTAQLLTQRGDQKRQEQQERPRNRESRRRKRRMPHPNQAVRRDGHTWHQEHGRNVPDFRPRPSEVEGSPQQRGHRRGPILPVSEQRGGGYGTYEGERRHRNPRIQLKIGDRPEPGERNGQRGDREEESEW